MTALIIIVVVLVVALAAAAFFIRQRNQQANIARADQLRQQAASQAQATIAPAQERAAAAEAEAEEARARAEQAEREAQEARTAAQQVEATHEGQVRAADRLDPRVDHTADDYAPQVPGTVDQGPVPPAEVNAEVDTQPATEPAAQPADETDGTRAPLLPRRTPGSNDMPGKPIEKTDSGGGWFTKNTGEESDKA